MTKDEFQHFCKTAWRKQHGLKESLLAVKITTVNLEAGFTNFTYQIKHKNIIFSL